MNNFPLYLYSYHSHYRVLPSIRRHPRYSLHLSNQLYMYNGNCQVNLYSLIDLFHRRSTYTRRYPPGNYSPSNLADMRKDIPRDHQGTCHCYCMSHSDSTEPLTHISHQHILVHTCTGSLQESLYRIHGYRLFCYRIHQNQFDSFDRSNHSYRNTSMIPGNSYKRHCSDKYV